VIKIIYTVKTLNSYYFQMLFKQPTFLELFKVKSYLSKATGVAAPVTLNNASDYRANGLLSG